MVRTMCAVWDCKSSSHRNKDLRFHVFPRANERCKSWIEACGRPDLLGRSSESLKHTYICSLHFEKKMYRKKYLKKIAIPTLLLPTKDWISSDATRYLPPDPAPSHLNVRSATHSRLLPLEKEESTDEYLRLSPDAASASGSDPKHEPAESPCTVKMEYESSHDDEDNSRTLKMEDECSDDEKDISLRQTIRNIAAKLDALKEEDSFDIFGRYVASIMRNLPPHRATAVQPKIVNLLMQAVNGSDDTPQC